MINFILICEVNNNIRKIKFDINDLFEKLILFNLF